MRRGVRDALAKSFPRLARRLAAAIALAILWSPRIAFACSVCTAGRDEANRVAFIATTVFLTFLPLLMIGGVVWWLIRRVRRHAEATEDPRRPATAARTAQA